MFALQGHRAAKGSNRFAGQNARQSLAVTSVTTFGVSGTSFGWDRWRRKPAPIAWGWIGGRVDIASDVPEFAQSSDLNLERRRQAAMTGWSSSKPKGVPGVAITHAMVKQRTRSRSKALGTQGDGGRTDDAGNSEGGRQANARNVERESAAVTRNGCERGEDSEG